jgi:hypothetical protein
VRPAHLLLAHAGGQVERTAEPHSLWYLAVEDLLHGGDPDRRQHRGEVAVGD